MTVIQVKMCDIVEESDEVDRLPSKDRATYWDIAALTISIASHLFDIGLDCNLAYRYYMNEHIYYFIFTLGFILVPAFINTAFSIRMFVYMHVTSNMDHLNGLIFVLTFQVYTRWGEEYSGIKV